jgi:Holliday junction resolvasome RuvABC endonuclease subunit
VIVVGVDPGTKSLGLAVLDNAGRVLETRPIIIAGSGDLRKRLHVVWSMVHGAFGVAARVNADRCLEEAVVVVIEDGIYHVHSSAISSLAECRGIIFSAAWAHHWKVVTVNPQTWKAKTMTMPERRMKKDATYITYWKRRVRWPVRTADQVDAILIARWFLATRRERFDGEET